MPVVRTDGRAYGHVITKFSRMGRLPHFLTHGAPLARFARQSSGNNNNDNNIIITIMMMMMMMMMILIIMIIIIIITINDDVSLHSLTKFSSFFDWYENA